jgi:hypothetical protein
MAASIPFKVSAFLFEIFMLGVKKHNNYTWDW